MTTRGIIVGLFSRKPKAPKVEALVVRPREGSVSHNIKVMDIVQPVVTAWAHREVNDFRISWKAHSGLINIAQDRSGAVFFAIGGQRVGNFPDVWAEGAQLLMARAREAGAPALFVDVEIEWEKKAGPYTMLAALGHSSWVPTMALVPLSQYRG